MKQQSTAASPEYGSIGAVPSKNGVLFRVWAPTSERVEVLLSGDEGERAVELDSAPGGWFSRTVPEEGPGTRYRYRLNGGDTYPDPCSRFQPDGVHEASEVVDSTAFQWTDAEWKGIPLEDAVIYELHVGTATPEGTFDALIPRLDHFVELGVTALELMPVAQFPGERNWGYDGVYWFAPAEVYGGPEGLRRLVDAAHARGLAVFLDVVYNHLGPEGNYLPAVTGGRIFTEKHHTPWGAAINYDDTGSEAVREIVLDNVLHWIHEYHIDGLRLDAAHAIIDASPKHILREIVERVHASTDRIVVIIAEDERNERKLLLPPAEGGIGLDAVWADDFHHQVRRRTAGDREGYFSAYTGSTADLVETLRKGWFYKGEFYPPKDEHRGTPAAGLPAPAFVHCIQNHDQVGNRALGERLNKQIDPAVYRAVSALLLLSPYTPLLWMGQEWAASSPFLYFTDHPEELGKLVTQGRREEFKGFSAFSDPRVREQIPDPQAPETFERSKLRWEEQEQPKHAGIQALYRDLLALRRSEPALQERGRESWQVDEVGTNGITLRRSNSTSTLLLAVCLEGSLQVELPEGGNWELVLGTEQERYGGSGERGTLSGTTLRLPRPGAVLVRSAGGSQE